jgi:quercetin dioxygenase-like cupin family protein
MPGSPSAAGASPQATLISAAGVSLVQRRRRPRRPQPPVQPWVFREERQLAFASDAASGLVLLDRSRELDLPGPGTTPSLLAAYLVIRSGEEVRSRFQGGLEFYFVIHGQGTSGWEGGCVSWQEGDVFYLPGGKDVAHQAMSDSRLYVLSDQPLARFLGLGPQGSTDQPLHYSGRDIRNAQALEYQTTGKSGVLHFGCDTHIVHSSFLPVWKWLRPGEHQVSHRHVAVAVQLFVTGHNSTSTIGDQRVRWEDFTVCVTPAGWLHAHQNEGDDVAVYLVAQDLPLYRYLRTYWHEEPDTGILLQDWLGS